MNNFGVKLENNPTNPNFPRTGSFISDKQKDSIEDDKYNCENADDDQKTSSKRFQLHRTINFTSFITVNHHNSQRFQEIVHHICFSPMIMEEREILWALTPLWWYQYQLNLTVLYLNFLIFQYFQMKHGFTAVLEDDQLRKINKIFKVQKRFLSLFLKIFYYQEDQLKISSANFSLPSYLSLVWQSVGHQDFSSGRGYGVWKPDDDFNNNPETYLQNK